MRSLVSTAIGLSLVAAGTFFIDVDSARADLTYAGCRALFDRAHGPGRLRIGEGQGGRLNNVISECRRRFGGQLNAHARARRENRQESVRLLTETLTGLETMKHRKPHRRDHVKERADRNYREGEALLRGMLGVEQRRNPWDYVRSHRKGHHH